MLFEDKQPIPGQKALWQEQEVAGSIVPIVRNPKENRKWGQAKNFQVLSLATYSTHQGSTSERFYNLLKHHDRLGSEGSNTRSSFTFKMQP